MGEGAIVIQGSGTWTSRSGRTVWWPRNAAQTGPDAREAFAWLLVTLDAATRAGAGLTITTPVRGSGAPATPPDW
jgi:hypothetical protein